MGINTRIFVYDRDKHYVKDCRNAFEIREKDTDKRITVHFKNDCFILEDIHESFFYLNFTGRNIFMVIQQY